MDLWPNLEELKGIKGVKEILAEQAQWLEKKSNASIYLAITEPNEFEDILLGDFVFVAQLGGTYLENYKYRLMKFWHGITMYPVTVEIDDDIKINEVKSESGTYILNNQAELESFLHGLFNSDKVKGVISAILSLSR